MKKEFYTIIGPNDEAGNQQYWDVSEWEWTTEFERATRYRTGHVFFQPPPPCSKGIMEFSEENKPIRWFEPGDPPLPGEVVGI
jgi:hypothetical protein